MNPDEFLDWLDEQIHFAEGFRNHVPKTKEQNRYWDGKIAALNEVKDKCLQSRPIPNQ